MEWLGWMLLVSVDLTASFPPGDASTRSSSVIIPVYWAVIYLFVAQECPASFLISISNPISMWCLLFEVFVGRRCSPSSSVLVVRRALWRTVCTIRVCERSSAPAVIGVYFLVYNSATSTSRFPEATFVKCVFDITNVWIRVASLAKSSFSPLSFVTLFFEKLVRWTERVANF